MKSKSLYDYTVEDLACLMLENVDAAVIVDPAIDAYKSIIRKGMFETFLKESGIYHDLILDLWFHFNDSNEKVSGDYQIFADNTGVFKSKYSRRLKIVLEDEKISHLVQLTVYPFDNASKYIFIMDEFDDNESLQESLTTKKINTIQNTYLFSMYIDLVADTTSSINVTEISDDVVNYNLKYSDWRMMIVNMIWPEDQEQFLSRTDPEYLKTHFTPGRTSSYDCMMRNLEGKFIWVKLIFSRAQTYNDDDYIDDADEADKVRSAIRVTTESMRSCCRRAYIRGAFLAAGSLSDPEKSYHFEIVCQDERQAHFLAELLDSFEIEAKTMIRKKYHVLYVKDGTRIVETLNVMGAHVALMDFENMRILKEMRNSVNRKVNCETANIGKTVSAAQRQIDEIRKLQGSDVYKELPPSLKAMAELRIEYPEATLQELGQCFVLSIRKQRYRSWDS